jgi:CMP-N-acetylneuraminic acid synthetase
MFMELVSDRDRRISIEDLNTCQLLAHATRQARQCKFDDLVIVDIDYRHYEKLAFQQHAGAAEREPDQARQSRGVA